MNNWDIVYKNGRSFTPMNELYLSELLALLKKKRKGKGIKTVLDLGCGRGGVVISLAQRKMDVTGVDFSRVAIHEAKKLASEKGVSARAQFTVHDLEKTHTLKFNKRFDLVICKLTYAFLKNKKQFLNSLHKLLAQGGVFVLVTPVLLKGTHYSAHLKNISVGKNQTEKSLKKEFGSFTIHYQRYFEDNGLEITYILFN